MGRPLQSGRGRGGCRLWCSGLWGVAAAALPHLCPTGPGGLPFPPPNQACSLVSGLGSAAVASSRSLIVRSWLLFCSAPRAEARPELDPYSLPLLLPDGPVLDMCSAYSAHLRLHPSTPLGGAIPLLTPCNCFSLKLGNISLIYCHLRRLRFMSMLVSLLMF